MIHQDMVTILDDPSSVVRATLLAETNTVYNILSGERFLDTWLPHISTYLNENDTMLRLYVPFILTLLLYLISIKRAIYNCISYMRKHVSQRSFEQFILPILLQLLSGIYLLIFFLLTWYWLLICLIHLQVQSELISAKIIQLFIEFYNSGHISSLVCREIMRNITPLLYYPSDILRYSDYHFYLRLSPFIWLPPLLIWIIGVINFIHAYAKVSNDVEIACHILPTMRKFAEIEPIFDNVTDLQFCLKKPVSYSIILDV